MNKDIKNNSTETELELIKVGELFVIQNMNEKKLIGTEIVFTDKVMNKQGAATVIDLLRGSIDTSGWVVQTIMRVGDQLNAQTNTPPESERSENNKVPPKPTRGRKKKAKANS